MAEAELKYEPEHQSTAVYFRMPIVNFPFDRKRKAQGNVWALVWTTTPWTLPSNDAIFYKDSATYCLVQHGNETYLVSEQALETLRKAVNDNVEVVERLDSSILADLRYVNPIDGQEKRFLAADYVDPTKGTGLTHGAFAHGFDDFAIGQKYGYDVKCFVDEDGNYDRIKYADSILCGRNVLNEGSDLVLKTYRNHVVATEKITHSYPYDWRTNRPVIVRASRQWFIDAEKLRKAAMEISKSSTRFYPEWANARMRKTLEDRPSGWCISRQRCWGVPLPIFYSTDGDEFFVDGEAIRHLAALVRNEGSDCWWNRQVDELLPEGSALRQKALRKGNDIFDIWFDSGMSWAAGRLPADQNGKVRIRIVTVAWKVSIV